MARLFVRRRDRRIEVRLNDDARAIAREAFGHVYAAEHDPDHEWHHTLNSPIDPSKDVDDPMSVLARQTQTGSNAELAIATLHEEFLNDAEAWAWLTTLQVSLRATAAAHGLFDAEKLAAADPELVAYINTIQLFLASLADVI